MMDKTRGALFNILGDDVIEARVLDLFAGTGAVGIEAISRGAKSVDFVELNPRTARLIKENLETARFTAQGFVHTRSVEDHLTSLRGIGADPFDLIFFTPPYAIFSLPLMRQALTLLKSQGSLVAELASKDEVSAEERATLNIWQEKMYGDTRLLFMMRG